MSTIVSAVDLWIPRSVAPDPTMGDKWEKALHAVSTIMNQRRKSKIPDEAAFQNKLAEPANQAWNGFVNPTFRSKKGRSMDQIKEAHDNNLQGAFNHWNGKLDQSFATVDGIEAKRFKDQVTASKGFWSEIVGGKMLRLTGDKVRGRGAATIATYWLIGEPMAVGMLRPQDTGVMGGPYRICQEDLTQSFQAALMSRLVQAGVWIFNSKYDAALIASQNVTINHLVQSFVDPAFGLIPFAPGGESHLDFVKEGTLLKISLKVSQV
jgi:hypothetical protein